MLQVEETRDGAWAALVEEVRRYVRRRVDAPDVVDDLVQEVFVRVHDRAEQLRDGDKLAAWIGRIAAHVVVDHYRRSGRQVPLEEEPVQVPEADEGLDMGPLLAWVATSVDSLEPAYRDVLRLTELQGMTQREAARRLGLSLTAVKSRVRRGRAKVEQAVHECCHVELDARGGVVDYAPRDPCQTACCD